MSPSTEPSFLISTRSWARTLPWILPYTTTSRAVTSECNCALRPAMSFWPCSAMGPSTLPSICRSSSPETFPLISRLGPRKERLRATELLGREDTFGPMGVTEDICSVELDVRLELGSDCLLLHMLSFLR